MWPFRPNTPSPAAHRVLLACLAIVLAAKAWFILATPLRALVMSPWLLDDSFITMQVAKNVAHLAKFSFDGASLTTGVAPLWTYIIAIPQFADSKDVAVKATLLLSTAFGAACSYVVYRIGAALTDERWTAVLAALLTALMPVQFFNAMNGMETAFFSLMILLALGGASGALRFARPAWAHGAWTGLFLGIAVLTRADSLFAIAAVGALKGWEWWTQPKRRRDVAVEAANVAAAVAVCITIFLVWQWAQTGSAFPDNQVGRRAIALEGHGFDFARFALAPYLKISLWNVFQLESLWTLATGSTLLSLLALAWACAKERTSATARATTLYIALFAGALCFYQWYFPDFHGWRYVNAGSHLAILFATLFAANAFEGKFRRASIGACCVVVLGLSWYRYVDTIRHYPAFKEMGIFGQSDVAVQDRFWAAIDWVKTSVPEDGTIALRDHGRMAFFTDRKIQDLAGILDADVLTARAEHRAGEYVTTVGKATHTFLPDPAPGTASVFQQMHDQLRLQRLVGAPNQEITGYKPYKVLGPKR